MNNRLLIEEKYQALGERERRIVWAAMSDPNRKRGLSVCRLYFPEISDVELEAFFEDRRKR